METVGLQLLLVGLGSASGGWTPRLRFDTNHVQGSLREPLADGLGVGLRASIYPNRHPNARLTRASHGCPPDPRRSVMSLVALRFLTAADNRCHRPQIGRASCRERV